MKKLLHNLGYVVSILLFVVAVVVIHHKLRQYHYRDIANQVLQTPLSFLFSAVILTFLNYLVLTGYDTLGLRYLGIPMKYPQIAMASFIGYGFGMNTAVVGGSAARSMSRVCKTRFLRMQLLIFDGCYAMHRGGRGIDVSWYIRCVRGGVSG